MRMHHVLAVIAATTLAGCVADQAYVCERSVECRRGDQQGVCESTGFCSFDDTTCGDAVRRYGALASPALANTCVPCVAELTAGTRFTCARTQAGELYCWGENAAGQIGDGSSGRVLSPALVATSSSGGTLGPASAIGAGTEHACGVFGDGALFCWGDNDAGELGNPNVATGQRRPTPVVDAGGTPVRGVTVAAGLSHSCAVDDGGAMSCWGENSANQLGISHLELASSPVPRLALDAVARPIVGADAYHSCALREDASLWCWGGNDDGQVGNGSIDNVSQPVPVLPFGSVRSAAIGNETSCAVSAGGEVQCWGSNTDGQVGDGSIINRSLPTPIDVTDVRTVAVGGAHACALRRDGSLWCWGRGTDGQLGPSTTTSLQPFEVRAAGVLALAAGGFHTCVLEADGVVRCFGANGSGQLGNGNAIGSPEPVDVSLPCR